MKTLLLAVALCACGGNGTFVDGSVSSKGIDAADVLVMSQAGAGGSLSIWIGDHTGFCDEMHGSQFLKNLDMLVLTMGIVGTDGVVTAADSAGRYQLAGQPGPGSRIAVADFWTMGACLSQSPVRATSGYIDLTHFKGTPGSPVEAEGTFSVVFAGGKLEGQFRAVIPCNVERGNFLLCN